MTFHIEIAVNQKIQRKQKTIVAEKKQLSNEHNIPDNYQKQLENFKSDFKSDYPMYKKLAEQNKYDQEKVFDDWNKTMKGKNYIGWYMPLRDEGPKMRKLVISKLTLKMLGYEPE